MRSLLILALLGLAGCSDFRVATAHYGFGNSDYDKYRKTREQALVTGEKNPTTVPVTLPVRALTPDEIAGRTEVAKAVTPRTQAKPYVPPAPAAATDNMQP